MLNKHAVLIDAERCIGCGMCQNDCPASNIAIADKKASVIAQDCIMCGHCVAICPKAAVSMTGFDEEPRDIKTAMRLDPREVLEAIRTRRTIRQFAERPVSDDVVADIVEAGRMTPTAKNAQDVSYVVLRDDLARAEALAVRLFRRLFPFVRLVNPMARRTTIDEHFFFKKAPVAVAVVSRDAVNGALAASSMALVAESHGLGVLYSGYFAMAVNASGALRKLLGLGRGEKAVAVLVLGHPAVKYRRIPQKESPVVRMQ